MRPNPTMHSLLAAIPLLAFPGRARADAEAQDDWSDRLEFGGLVEIEAGYTDPDGGDTERTLNLTTVELGLAARINSMISAEATLLYEDDGERKVTLDSVSVSVMPSENWSVVAGQFYLPFGIYESAMISDPLTLELGEIRENALLVSRVSGKFTTSVYLFAGDVSERSGDSVDNFGISLGYAVEGDDLDFAGSAGYINDIQDSDTLQDAIAGPADRAGGMYASALLASGPVALIAEYVGATEKLQTGEQPYALNLEIDYALRITRYDAVFALGFQTTHDAVSLGLPQTTILTALSLGILENTSLAFEYARAEDYSGADTHTLTAQLAVEF